VDVTWFGQAACFDKDYLFFSSKPSTIEKAVKVCQSCNFMEECLAVASHHKVTTGVWGGKYGKSLKDAIRECV